MSEHALSDIAQWFENEIGSFTIGTNLFVGHIPLKRVDGTVPPDRACVLLENAGGITHGDLEDRDDKAVQFLCRAKAYTDARADVNLAYALAHGNEGIRLPIFDTSSGTRYVAMTIEAISSPTNLGQDDGGRWNFTVDFIFRLRDF